MLIGCYGYANALEAFHFAHISYLVTFVLSVRLSLSFAPFLNFFCQFHSIFPSVVLFVS